MENGKDSQNITDIVYGVAIFIMLFIMILGMVLWAIKSN